MMAKKRRRRSLANLPRPSLRMIQRFSLNKEHVVGILGNYCIKFGLEVEYHQLSSNETLAQGTLQRYNMPMEIKYQCVINGEEFSIGSGVSEKTAKRNAAFKAFTLIMEKTEAESVGCKRKKMKSKKRPKHGAQVNESEKQELCNKTRQQTKHKEQNSENKKQTDLYPSSILKQMSSELQNLVDQKQSTIWNQLKFKCGISLESRKEGNETDFGDASHRFTFSRMPKEYLHEFIDNTGRFVYSVGNHRTMLLSNESRPTATATSEERDDEGPVNTVDDISCHEIQIHGNFPCTSEPVANVTGCIRTSVVETRTKQSEVESDQSMKRKRSVCENETESTEDHFEEFVNEMLSDIQKSICMNSQKEQTRKQKQEKHVNLSVTIGNGGGMKKESSHRQVICTLGLLDENTGIEGRDAVHTDTGLGDNRFLHLGKKDNIQMSISTGKMETITSTKQEASNVTHLDENVECNTAVDSEIEQNESFLMESGEHDINHITAASTVENDKISERRVVTVTAQEAVNVDDTVSCDKSQTKKLVIDLDKDNTNTRMSIPETEVFKFKCDLCLAVSTYKETMLNHLKNAMHYSASLVTVDITGVPKNIVRQYLLTYEPARFKTLIPVCPIERCWAVFSHIYACATHNNLFHDPEEGAVYALAEVVKRETIFSYYLHNTCNVCSEIFPTSKDLFAHMKVMKHFPHSTVEDTKAIFMCCYCQKTYMDFWLAFSHCKRKRGHLGNIEVLHISKARLKKTILPFKQATDGNKIIDSEINNLKQLKKCAGKMEKKQINRKIKEIHGIRMLNENEKLYSNFCSHLNHV